MNPRLDGYFLSTLSRHEERHAGVHMVFEYFSYLKLFGDGRWLTKNHPTLLLDFRDYLDRVTEKDFEDGWA